MRSNAKNYFAPTQDRARAQPVRRHRGGPLLRNSCSSSAATRACARRRARCSSPTSRTRVACSGDFSSVSTPSSTRSPACRSPATAFRESHHAVRARCSSPPFPAPNTAGANNYRVIRDFTDDTDTRDGPPRPGAECGHTLFQRYIWYDSQQSSAGAITDTGRPQTGGTSRSGTPG